MFTGKYPQNHGIPRNGFVLNPENVMLTQILKEAGFHTTGFLGSFALDSRFGFGRAFDNFDEDFDLTMGSEGREQNERIGESVTNSVIRHLDDTGVPENLFLFAHYFDPRCPRPTSTSSRRSRTSWVFRPRPVSTGSRTT